MTTTFESVVLTGDADADREAMRAALLADNPDVGDPEIDAWNHAAIERVLDFMTAPYETSPQEQGEPKMTRFALFSDAAFALEDGVATPLTVETYRALNGTTKALVDGVEQTFVVSKRPAAYLHGQLVFDGELYTVAGDDA